MTIEQQKYNSDVLDQQIQRHVHPLWVKDELNTHHYLGTTTFVQYQNFYCLITAAHVIPINEKLEHLYFLTTEGFFCIDQMVNAIHRNDGIDLAIMPVHSIWANKNYFDLSYSLSLISAPYLHYETASDINWNHVCWMGFPKGKKTNYLIHPTKNNEKGLKTLLRKDEINHPDPYIKQQNYFILATMIKNISAEKVFLHFDPKKELSYKYSPKKGKCPSLIGMSGGAIFHISKNSNKFTKQSDISKMLIFTGIGTECNNRDTITGISIYSIVRHIRSLIPLYKIHAPIENDIPLKYISPE